VTLASGKQYILDAINAEQKIKVSINAENPVSAFIYLKKDQDSAEKELFAERKPTILAWQAKAATFELEATIPAKQEAMVNIQVFKKTKVTVKITN